jgi:hypothetical protein
MAKQGKALPARRLQETDSSLFLRSAESLGRVIGTLQRQLDNASKRMTDHGDDGQSATATSNGTGSRKGATARHQNDPGRGIDQKDHREQRAQDEEAGGEEDDATQLISSPECATASRYDAPPMRPLPPSTSTRASSPRS